MIDRSQFSLERLLNMLLDTHFGNRNKWWDVCEIVETEQPKRWPESWGVRCKERWLRRIPGSECIWDILYGEDSEFYSPEHALIALLVAPVPPFLLKPECWEKESDGSLLQHYQPN